MTNILGFSIDIPTTAIGGALLGLCIYFFKKADKKVDENAAQILELRSDFAELKTDTKVQIASLRDDLKEDMIEIFNGACHERQVACKELQEIKVKGIESREVNICNKIRRLEEQRSEDWSEQKRWNTRIEDRLNTNNRFGGPTK